MNIQPTPVGVIGALCMVSAALIASRVSQILSSQLYDGLARNYITRFVEPAAPDVDNTRAAT